MLQELFNADHGSLFVYHVVLSGLSEGDELASNDKNDCAILGVPADQPIGRLELRAFQSRHYGLFVLAVKAFEESLHYGILHEELSDLLNLGVSGRQLDDLVVLMPEDIVVENFEGLLRGQLQDPIAGHGVLARLHLNLPER